MTRITTRLAAGVVTATLLLAGAACSSGSGREESAQGSGQKQTETVFKKLQAAVPYPTASLNDSLERRNLSERLQRYNRPDKISYIYLLGQTGNVVSFMTIKGKVSSTQSQMTTDQLIQRCYYQNSCVVNAPGDDGSYGPNEPGIFFFTTENVLVQWDGPYLLADAPLKITSAPVVILEKGATPSSTAGVLK